MNPKFLALLIGVGIVGIQPSAAVLGTQKVSKPHFRLKDFELTNLGPYRYHVVSKAESEISATGTPRFTAIIKSSNTTIDATQLNGTIVNGKQTLKAADLKGGVAITVNSVAKSQPRTTNINSETVHLTAGASAGQFTFTTPQAVDFKSSVPSLDQLLSLNGSSGVFKLAKRQDQTELTSADVEGPVNFSYKSKSVDQSGKVEVDEKGNPLISNIHGHANHLSINREGDNYRMILKGDVKVTGDRSDFITGDLAGDDLFLIFSSDGQLIESGSSAPTTMTTDPSAYASHRAPAKGRPGR